MCQFVPPKSSFTVFIYWNSIFQAISLYILAIYFDGFSRLFNDSLNRVVKTEHDGKLYNLYLHFIENV